MQREILQRLEDVRSAAELIVEYTRAITEAEYLADRKTRDAVDRRLAIIGEALGRVSKLDPAFAESFPETPQVVSLRNVLIHEYGQVEDELIWRLVQQEVPALLQRATATIRHIKESTK